MAEGYVGEKSLNKNSIDKFILRVDIIKNEQLKIADLATEMSKHFDRTEKRQISGFTINFTKDNSHVTKQEAFHYVLISEKDSVSMTFSERDNAFWIESNQYKDNSLYKDRMETIVNVLVDKKISAESKRIGLRYVNEFKCDNPKSISHIYGKRLAPITKKMLSGTNQSRVIGIEEENNNGYKLRLQYGVLNKFYPSIISVYDLILDIDSYIESSNNPQEWEEIIVNLNHAAYEKFINEINPSYLEELK